ncbi:hypothetical protein O181_086987 [Austropuccinia psidii MF-1]|uniref:Uncharacterized protein n=1 Tax=Austropuccinia psidii MF-1 TaxID=1389203 RepID=A0A9Q3INT7_9BASI|nr:hypothetical protein [Austropuccinia psidii MF-1]
MKDLGKEDMILGIQVRHLSNSVSLLKSHFIEEISQIYNVYELPPLKTSLKPHMQLEPPSRKEIEELKPTGINYRSTVGYLNYISSNKRPDITFLGQSSFSVIRKSRNTPLERVPEISQISSPCQESLS